MKNPAKRIPIAATKNIAKKYGQRQVILVTWDGKTTHVVTYGTSLTDCDQAATGGNTVKKWLGWPESLQHAVPSRIVRLNKTAFAKMQNELRALRDAAKDFIDKVDRGEARSSKSYQKFKDALGIKATLA